MLGLTFRTLFAFLFFSFWCFFSFHAFFWTDFKGFHPSPIILFTAVLVAGPMGAVCIPDTLKSNANVHFYCFRVIHGS